MSYRFVETLEAKKQKEYSSTAIKAILDIKDIPDDYKKSLIHNMIWKISGANGKYKTIYCSEGVLLAGKSRIIHEHVFTIDYIKDRFLRIDKQNYKEEFDKVLFLIVACLVTDKEHDDLTPMDKDDAKLKLIGWERYKEKNIKVFNMEYDKPAECDIDELIKLYSY